MFCSVNFFNMNTSIEITCKAAKLNKQQYRVTDPGNRHSLRKLHPFAKSIAFPLLNTIVILQQMMQF